MAYLMTGIARLRGGCVTGTRAMTDILLVWNLLLWRQHLVGGSARPGVPLGRGVVTASRTLETVESPRRASVWRWNGEETAVPDAFQTPAATLNR